VRENRFSTGDTTRDDDDDDNRLLSRALVDLFFVSDRFRELRYPCLRKLDATGNEDERNEMAERFT
jgi:hypothetical protein